MVNISIYMTIQYTSIYLFYKTIYLSLFKCINISLTSHLAYKVKLGASKHYPSIYFIQAGEWKMSENKS